MGDKAMSDGAEAFRRGLPRAGNPYDASNEDWMCWRDGWEQARAVAERPEEAATAERHVAPLGAT